MIEFTHVSKRFTSKEKKYLGKYFVRHIMQNLLRRLQGREALGTKLVLKDVSFRIGKGEQVGLIGRNKAGKSTLLQLIAGISAPSSGRVRVCGRVIPSYGQGSISTPDLTGREYIYLYAAALGASKSEITVMLPQIVDFCEIKDLDTPVKYYSTGMRTRLSLGITLLQPADIYILDEVFYGSDAFFRQKVADYLDGICANAEKTVILISHNEDIVRRFCKRLLLLEDGVVKMDGDVAGVYDHYLRHLDPSERPQDKESMLDITS